MTDFFSLFFGSKEVLACLYTLVLSLHGLLVQINFSDILDVCLLVWWIGGNCTVSLGSHNQLYTNQRHQSQPATHFCNL